MIIDLHIHSKNSDGTDTIDEIVSKSKDQQLQAISITDHEYLSEVKDNEGIEIISGVEMSVSWNDLDLQNPYSGIHLLIYFLEKNTPLDQMLFKIREEKTNRNYEILDKLKNIGIEIEKDELENLETKVPGRPHIANLMKSKGHVSTLNEAFQKYLGNGKVGDSRIHQNQITDVIQVAKESKSLIFLAHPHTLVSNKNYSFSKNWHNESFFKILEKLKGLGIDGVETYYSSYSKSTSNSLEEITDTLNLLRSGGSDYHGMNKPNINIGFGYENNQLNIPYDLIEKMKEKHAEL
jgi:predicted metal-dependent phosphoesterase TrpH